MNKKEYLNEEWYQNAKKKILKISLVVFVITFIIGGGLIAFGVIKTNLDKSNAKKQTEERYNEALKKSEENVATAKERLAEIEKEKENVSTKISEIETKISNMEIEIKNMENDKSKIFRDDRGFSDRYYAKDNEITVKLQEKSKLKDELRNLKSNLNKINSEINSINNADYTVYYDEVKPREYYYLCIIGGVIIAFGSFIALSIYLVAMRREITAFSTQQVMPLAQEGIDKMAPTIGNAAGTIAGTIAESVSKGIKNGLNDNNNNKED